MQLKLSHLWTRHGAIVLLLVSSLSACVYSDWPLSDKPSKDDRLCGKWTLADPKPGEQMQLDITSDKDHWYQVEAIEHSQTEPKEHRSVDRCYPTKIGSDDFLNVELAATNKEAGSIEETSPPKFMFVKYAISKDELSIWNVSEEQLVKDIYAKKLNGEVDSGNAPWRAIRLHGQGAALVKYFQNQPSEGLFSFAGRFKRG